MEPRPEDAFGTALLDALSGERGRHIVERNDGLVDAMDASDYFLEPDSWSGVWPDADLAAIDDVTDPDPEYLAVLRTARRVTSPHDGRGTGSSPVPLVGH